MKLTRQEFQAGYRKVEVVDMFMLLDEARLELQDDRMCVCIRFGLPCPSFPADPEIKTVPTVVSPPLRTPLLRAA